MNPNIANHVRAGYPGLYLVAMRKPASKLTSRRLRDEGIPAPTDEDGISRTTINEWNMGIDEGGLNLEGGLTTQ